MLILGILGVRQSNKSKDAQVSIIQNALKNKENSLESEGKSHKDAVLAEAKAEKAVAHAKHNADRVGPDGLREQLLARLRRGSSK